MGRAGRAARSCVPAALRGSSARRPTYGLRRTKWRRPARHVIEPLPSPAAPTGHDVGGISLAALRRSPPGTPTARWAPGPAEHRTLAANAELGRALTALWPPLRPDSPPSHGGGSVPPAASHRA